MSRSVFARLRLLGPVTAAAALGLGTLPVMAQTTTTAPLASDCSAIHFELANPSPGSMIAPGGIVLQGIALDSRAQGSVGVDRVDFFLDNRDQGGEESVFDQILSSLVAGEAEILSVALRSSPPSRFPATISKSL